MANEKNESREMEKIEGWGSPSDQYEVINQN